MRCIVTLLIAEEALDILVRIVASDHQFLISGQVFGLLVNFPLHFQSVFLGHHCLATKLLDAVLLLMPQLPTVEAPHLLACQLMRRSCVSFGAVLEPMADHAAFEAGLSVAAHGTLQSHPCLGLLEALILAVALSLASRAVRRRLLLLGGVDRRCEVFRHRTVFELMAFNLAPRAQLLFLLGLRFLLFHLANY